MESNAVMDKSLDFAVRIVKLRKYLAKEKQEYILSKQLLRCGTSIGANIAEAQKDKSTLTLGIIVHYAFCIVHYWKMWDFL